jgi:hypothetical protein
MVNLMRVLWCWRTGEIPAPAIDSNPTHVPKMEERSCSRARAPHNDVSSVATKDCRVAARRPHTSGSHISQSIGRFVAGGVQTATKPNINSAETATHTHWSDICCWARDSKPFPNRREIESTTQMTHQRHTQKMTRGREESLQE